MDRIILSVGYNETGTHFIFYGLDDQELFRTHVNDIEHVNIHNVLDGQALETIRRDFYPEYNEDNAMTDAFYGVTGCLCRMTGDPTLVAANLQVPTWTPNASCPYHGTEPA